MRVLHEVVDQTDSQFDRKYYRNLIEQDALKDIGFEPVDDSKYEGWAIKKHPIKTQPLLG